MVKLAIDAGHGRNTPGKRCLKSLDPNETREWILNSRVVDYVEKELKNYTGIQLLRLDDPTSKRDVPLKERTNKANRWGADILISVHHNAGIGGGSGGGIMVYRYPNTKNITKTYQRKIYDKLIKHTGLKGNRGNPLANGNLHMLRESKMPAVLIENGFMDSKTDVPIILSNSHARKTANAIVEFVVEEFKLKRKQKPKTSSPSTETYKVVKGDNLTKIAKRFETTVRDLVKINKISDPNKIYVGQVLKIPSKKPSRIKVGSKVRIKPGSRSYDGVSLASFVYKNTYRVDQLKGNRALLDKNGICTPVNIKDLILV